MITLPLEMVREMQSLARLFNRYKNKELIKDYNLYTGKDLDSAFFELGEDSLMLKFVDGINFLFKEYNIKGAYGGVCDYSVGLEKFAYFKAPEIYIRENEVRIKKFFNEYDLLKIVDNYTASLFEIEFEEIAPSIENFKGTDAFKLLEGCEVLSVGKKDYFYKIETNNFTLITFKKD